MKIRNIILRRTYDSRSRETLEAEFHPVNLPKIFAAVPSGKSRGKREAMVFPFQKAKFAFLRHLAAKLTGKNFKSVAEFDEILLRTDRTENKNILGGNLTLALSLAFAKALAMSRSRALWQLLNREFFEPGDLRKRPLIFANFINGGLHADNNLDLQEFQVIVKPQKSLFSTTNQLAELFFRLGAHLKKNSGSSALAVGDEAGFSANFPKNFSALALLEKLIPSRALMGIDAAASNFYRQGHYLFERKTLSRPRLLRVYESYFKNFKKLLAIEDPFSEDDPAGFLNLRDKAKKDKWIIGDDLTTTNPRNIEHCAAAGLINAVVIKPNQIGTLTETAAAIRTAKRFKLKTVISHRSGEVEENFIIHVARASGADAVKIGAPARERIYKYNELIRIYDKNGF